LQTFKKNTTKVVEVLGSNFIVHFIVIWHFVGYLSLKIRPVYYSDIFNFFNFFLIFFLLAYVGVSGVLQSNFFKKLSIYHSVTLLLFILTYVYVLCTDFITLLLVVETITTVYYFFFLKHSLNTEITLSKYKNLISYYLWLSFFTLLFFTLNLFQWIYMYGTLNFKELQFFLTDSLSVNFILVAFFWKLGVPVFHFFKLELYKYLDFVPMLMFSILSLLINTILFLYLLNVLSVVLNYSLFIVFIVLVINILLLIQGLDKIFMFYFFAISGVNTWAFFLIIGLA